MHGERCSVDDMWQQARLSDDDIRRLRRIYLTGLAELETGDVKDRERSLWALDGFVWRIWEEFGIDLRVATE